MKRIGFLSFGHWTPSPQSQTRSASDALLQSIDLAVAAEEARCGRGILQGAPLRPPAFLAVSAARGNRLSDPHDRDRDRRDRYALREPALHGRGCGLCRPHLGWAPAARHKPWIARTGSSRGYRYFGYLPPEGADSADMAREHARIFLDVLNGEGFAQPNPRPMFPNPPGLLRRRAALPMVCASGSGGVQAHGRTPHGPPNKG